MSYNGWTNWETWQILLWADNEEPLYRWLMDWCGQWRGGMLPDSRSVEMLFRDMFPDGTPDMDSCDDMDKVNWREITIHIQDRVEEIKTESE